MLNPLFLNFYFTLEDEFFYTISWNEIPCLNMLIIDILSLDSADGGLGGEWYSGGQKERSRVAHASLEYVWAPRSHLNSEHTLFPPSATHTFTNERRIVEFHGYGVVKWSDGCGWMALVSQQALPLHLSLSLCGHWQAHFDKYWCTDAASFLKINLRADATHASVCETVSKIPSREAARRPCKDAF